MSLDIRCFAAVSSMARSEISEICNGTGYDPEQDGRVQVVKTVTVSIRLVTCIVRQMLMSRAYGRDLRRRIT